MELRDIVPWGRSFDEYRAMFMLSDTDLAGRILGCGDGPASFNAEASARGVQVVSVDPLYAFDAEVIAERIAEVRPRIAAWLSAAPERCIWSRFTDVEDLVQTRLATMSRFLADYPGPHLHSRYLEAALPTLPFADQHFDLALVSHLLFTYSDHLDADAHRAGIAELLRVSCEVRIFPLVKLDGETSPHLGPVIAQAEAVGWRVEQVPVEYRFQRGADCMLRLRKPC